MSTQENVAVVRRFAERLSRGELAAVDDLVTDDVVFHDGPSGLSPGIAG
jgi:hypothetical protein